MHVYMYVLPSGGTMGWSKSAGTGWWGDIITRCILYACMHEDCVCSQTVVWGGYF